MSTSRANRSWVLFVVAVILFGGILPFGKTLGKQTFSRSPISHTGPDELSSSKDPGKTDTLSSLGESAEINDQLSLDEVEVSASSTDLNVRFLMAVHSECSATAKDYSGPMVCERNGRSPPRLAV